MPLFAIAALVYASVTVAAVLFQFALALGAPWGAYALGGRFPDRLPVRMRVAAVVQGAVLLLLAAAVLARAGLAFGGLLPETSWSIWVVVAFSAVSLVLNSITPSLRERSIWAPVAALMLITSLIVALAAPT